LLKGWGKAARLIGLGEKEGRRQVLREFAREEGVGRRFEQYRNCQKGKKVLSWFFKRNGFLGGARGAPKKGMFCPK